MNALFYVSGAIAVISGLMVVTQANAMRALINLIVLLLAIASVFYTLGAPFVAVLQIVVYAGAIIVLFVFTIMMLNLSEEAERRERGWLASVMWALPVVLAAILLAEFTYTLASTRAPSMAEITPRVVGVSLFTDYIIGVELASVLLLAALVGAFHYGWIASRLESRDE
jgi:NADH-quinone oxidoreductase subunit J